MLFNTLNFGAFFVGVFFAYWSLPARFRNGLLLVASYYFYGSWDYRFLSLIVVSTLVDYTLGLRLSRTDDVPTRKLFLLTSVLVNIGILVVFKYAGFFVDTAADALQAFGLRPNRPFLDIILPVGISFYSFQTLSYTFDVYRRRIPPCTNLLDFSVYVAFFPQLVAGPIERASHLLPQIQRTDRQFSWTTVKSGSALILLGLFRKVVLADMVAPVSDAAFNNANRAGWPQLVVGLYAFALQIYGDFAGYSNIARGTARLLGIELVVNFRQPYLSRNISEFWRTWHMSLSAWLHDYLYIPLGGNREGRMRTYRNLMLTMILGGLWHGAAWTFVIWGLLHGLALAIHRAFGRYVKRGFNEPLGGWSDAWRIIGTFHLVAFGWAFFRADSLGSALGYIGGIVSFRGGPVPEGDFVLLLALAGLSMFIDLAQRNSTVELPVFRLAPWARGVVYGFALTGIIVASGQPVQNFIYFQF